MSATSISFPNVDSPWNGLIEILDKLLKKRDKNIIVEIRVPAFRIEEFYNELGRNGIEIGGVNPDRQRVFGIGIEGYRGMGGIPVVINTDLNTMYLSSLALVYFSDGSVRRVLSEYPIRTVEEFGKAIAEMEAYKCQNSKMRVRLSSID